MPSSETAGITAEYDKSWEKPGMVRDDKVLAKVVRYIR
jgi:hypothetical protein